MPMEPRLPVNLYRAAQVRELDRTAIQGHHIPGRTLMERAGTYAFAQLRLRWPTARRIAVVCGVGNNAGDGFVVARQALAAGLEVELLQLGDPAKLRGDALANSQSWESMGGRERRVERISDQVEVIVDAVLGTGLEREVTGGWAAALSAINNHPAGVLAIDIPSGLNSDNGRIMGTAVRADLTATFIGLKQGMFTGEGPELCGAIRFHDLDVPTAVYRGIAPAAWRDRWDEGGCDGALRLPPRPRSAHKGDFGHVLVIGGDYGFGGAARLAGEGALRVGAGLVSIATRPQHAAILTSNRPELMCKAIDKGADLDALLEKARVIVIGPGLGQSEWSRELWQRALDAPQPKIVDADALNLLALNPTHRNDWILTPHPGEAGRLLGIPAAEVQDERFKALNRLQQKFGGILILKGAGTLIASPAESAPFVCGDGNPGMASGGMGDVLSGVVGGLVAQKLDLTSAARMGVCLHAAAADRAATTMGERGLLASDLFAELRRLLNNMVS